MLRVNYNLPFQWAGGSSESNAEFIRQGGVQFRWNEIDIRYEPNTDDTTNLEWKRSDGIRLAKNS